MAPPRPVLPLGKLGSCPGCMAKEGAKIGREAQKLAKRRQLRAKKGTYNFSIRKI